MTPTNHGAHHYSDAELHNEDVAHEHSDINIRTVLAFGAGMAVVVFASALLVWVVFRTLESQARRDDPQVSPLAAPSGQPPRAPNLLTDESGNLGKFRMEETQTLEGYGWVDQAGGVAHVPIEQAKKLLIQRGLPVRAGTHVDTALGTNAPASGEASGGRMIPTGAAQRPAPPADAGASAAQPIKK